MQEEVTQKTIALVFKSSRLTADVLKKAMKMYLERRKAGQQATHGKMSVKKLVGQGMGASSIEVTDNNIKSFERVTLHGAPAGGGLPEGWCSDDAEHHRHRDPDR